MKIHIHTKLIWPIILFAVFAGYSFYNIQVYGINLSSLISLLASLIFVLVGLFMIWKHRHKGEFRISSPEKLTIEYSEQEILFPDGYYFRHSTIQKAGMVSFNRISEVNPETFPPSMVINDCEVIFLTMDDREPLIKFAERNKIRIANRFDIWEHINQPFLDTEFEKPEKVATIKALEQNGVPAAEVKKIRRKISLTMSLNHLIWEWTYLGHFDLLKWSLPLTRKRYWWSMDIALRNFRNE